jgi:hypothetical protein
MDIFDIFVMLWLLINLPGIYYITIAAWKHSEYNLYELLFFPVLIKELRYKLNKAGIIIVTTLFSILFAPAIVVHFILLFLVILAFLIYIGFMSIFERKD